MSLRAIRQGTGVPLWSTQLRPALLGVEPSWPPDQLMSTAPCFLLRLGLLLYATAAVQKQVGMESQALGEGQGSEAPL